MPVLTQDGSNIWDEYADTVVTWVVCSKGVHDTLDWVKGKQTIYASIQNFVKTSIAATTNIRLNMGLAQLDHNILKDLSFFHATLV